MKYIFLRISFSQTLMHSVCMSANKTSKKNITNTHGKVKICTNSDCCTNSAMLSKNIQHNISPTPRDVMLQCLHAKLYVALVAVFCIPLLYLSSRITLRLSRFFFYCTTRILSIVGWKMNETVCAHIHTIACIHTWGNQTACLLVPDWLWIFFSVSSLPFIHNSVRFRIFNRSAAGRSRSCRSSLYRG